MHLLSTWTCLFWQQLCCRKNTHTKLATNLLSLVCCCFFVLELWLNKRNPDSLDDSVPESLSSPSLARLFPAAAAAAGPEPAADDEEEWWPPLPRPRFLLIPAISAEMTAVRWFQLHLHSKTSPDTPFFQGRIQPENQLKAAEELKEVVVHQGNAERKRRRDIRGQTSSDFKSPDASGSISFRFDFFGSFFPAAACCNRGTFAQSQSVVGH